MKKIGNDRAITLIALVLTIIILLLLAGISISMLSGQDGILNKAAKAKKENIETEKYDELKLIVQDLLISGLGKVDIDSSSTSENSLTKTVKDKFGQDAYIDDGVVEIDGSLYAVTEEGKVTKGGMRVGDTVTYIPPEVTNAVWSASLSGATVKGLLEEDKILNNTLDISDENSFKVTNWKVLDVKEDGTVELISEQPTIGQVPIAHIQGYNNAVKLMDDTCYALYGNEGKGIKARNIKIEDIEAKMTKEGLDSSHSFDLCSVRYGEQDIIPYTEMKKYPAIYANENLSVIDGNKNTEGLAKSEQDKYYTGSITAETSIQPYQTHWAKNNEEIKLALGGENSIEYKLIIPQGLNTKYWISSRCIGTYETHCYYGVRLINEGRVTAPGIYGSQGDFDGFNESLRPVVYMNYQLLERAEDGTWSVK